jgi:(R,R)-butanediol dehydrogenase/meso-butanediol dehydrogenase/diacetyl reductase
MRAARLHGREDLRLEDVPEPSAGAGDVKLRVLYAGICGTDIHELYDGPLWVPTGRPHPLTGVQAPVILGHELCGEVVEVGDGVTTCARGDLVAVEPLQPCGRCAYCTSGAYNLCPTRAAHGLARDGGGFSELTVVEERMAHRLPPGLTPIQGALVEPMAVGVHAVKLTQAEPGAWAAVHGLGPIGLGVLLALRARGVETIASDPSARRRAAVEALGFRHVLDPGAGDVAEAIRDLTDGRGAVASVDAAGVPAALAAALESTAVHGRIVVVAVPLEPLTLPIPAFRRHEVTLTMSGGQLAEDFHDTIAGMQRGDYPHEGWVDVIRFDDLLAEGFEPLHRQEKLKVLVDVGAG